MNRPTFPRRGSIAFALVLVATTTSTTATATQDASERSPRAQVTSFFDDPCDAGGLDLRQLTASDLYDRANDGTAVGPASGQAAFNFTFCAPIDDGQTSGVRIDFHPRDDEPQLADYSETPSRTLVVRPAGVEWQWELRDLVGTTTTVIATGSADARGPATARTGVAASVPADEIRAAGRGGEGPLPELALRACSQDVDCGPLYSSDELADPVTEPSPAVDYLPDPPQLSLTYPSVCQVVGPTTSATEFVASPTTAKALASRGWRPLGPVLGGEAVRMHGDADAARAVDPQLEVSDVGVRRVATRRPDDPLYRDPDGDAPETGQWNFERVGAPFAWELTTGDPDVLVAVLDSGFDGGHPDLAGRAVGGIDLVATRDGPTVRPLPVDRDTDLGGHGSFVASLAAAATDDATGMAGLGWRTRLLVARVFDAEGCASDAAIAQAIEWAAGAGADAINLSLGGPEPATVLREAGEAALAVGAVPVAASGNTNRTGSPVIEYPAAYSAYVSVGATGYADGSDPDEVAFYSTRNGEVDLVAPGGSGSSDVSEDVLGACWENATLGHGYCRHVGTSFAAPHVAAAVALARSLDPARTGVGVAELLTDTAEDLDNGGVDGTAAGDDDASGSGMLRLDRVTRRLAERRETLALLSSDADPVAASVAASAITFGAGGAAHGVLARRDVFADTLAGAPLAGRHGPILLTETGRLDDRVSAELQRVLPPGATVFLLGGDAALAPAVEQAVIDLGYRPLRLAGPSRIETAVAIARHLGVGAQGRVLVASAANWPDAIAGGAYAAAARVPLLLSWPDDGDRAAATLQLLGELRPTEIVMLGGTAALSDEVTRDLDRTVPGAVRRVAGGTRFETAVAVAGDLWRRVARGADDQYVVVDGDREDGWAYGLVASPLIARRGAPLLLVNAGLTTSEPTEFLRWVMRYRLDAPAVATIVGPIGGEQTVQRLRELLGG